MVLNLAFELKVKRSGFNETLDWLQAGVELHPDSDQLHFVAANLYFHNKNFAVAAKLLQRVTALNPGNANAHSLLGASLQMLGEHEKALASFEAAVRIDPTLWAANHSIGNLYKMLGHPYKALEPFQRALFTRHKLGDELILDGEFTRTSRSKLRHDVEQLAYLAEREIGGPPVKAALQALNQVETAMQPYFTGHLAEFPAHIKPIAAPYYNRLLNHYNAPALPGGALNQDQDWAAIEAAYVTNAPGIIFIDNFLKPEALASLRRFCLESTIWFENRYSNGYLGCVDEQGFGCPLLAQIAEEQRLALPGIFDDSRLTGLWGYKYDSKMSGISVHADYAAVNVNFWITPDSANLNPERGGLIVWDKEAPRDWDFSDYNGNAPRIDKFLQESGANPVVIPHKQNRVAIFNSDLFHRTDDYHFKEGYENRRINITMLYGDRRKT
ncbi:hypothetical protein GCM10011396_50170 [Undibacterium terreum]|uniref:Tetratricopeptide repeat protein n=2 Tax=Undibacterium terreum TaxID=1224302 RepID=A0A916V010_9BURK|nr:hypothetical protein GCM10011396_50170 [Undibacterium terreum]